MGSQITRLVIVGKVKHKPKLIWAESSWVKQSWAESSLVNLSQFELSWVNLSRDETMGKDFKRVDKGLSQAELITVELSQTNSNKVELSWVKLNWAEWAESRWFKMSQTESSRVECNFFSDQTLLRRNRIGLVLDIGIPPIGNFLIHQHVQARRHISGWLFRYRITLSTLEMWPVRRKFSAFLFYIFKDI